MKHPVPTLLLTMEEVMRLSGYRSRSSIYRLVRRGLAPPPVLIGSGRVRWRAEDVEQWLQALPGQLERVSSHEPAA